MADKEYQKRSALSADPAPAAEYPEEPRWSIEGRSAVHGKGGPPPVAPDSGEAGSVGFLEPKFVASRTLDRLNWNNSFLLEGDVAVEVAKLKAQDGGEIQVHGSGNLLQTLLAHDLVDTLRVWLFPVVIGTGKRLFGEGTIPRSFRMVETELNTTGAVLHVYDRVGELRHGEVEVGQETVIFQ